MDLGKSPVKNALSTRDLNDNRRPEINWTIVSDTLRYQELPGVK